MNPHQPPSAQAPGPTYSADRDLFLGGKNVAGDEINAHTIHLVKAENYYAAPHIIPTGSAAPASAIEHFVDRGTVMNEVRAALGRGDTAAIVGVRGMGGVGKTELAKFLAREFETAHPNGLMWIDVNERGLELIHTDMARVLGIELGAGWDAQTRHNALRGALAQSSVRLVVLDDVRASFARSLPLCLPPAPPCAALITSRRTDLPGVSANRMFPLDVMTESQSLELLWAEGPRAALEREPQAATALAKRCGYHPLALTLAAKRLHKRVGDSTTPVAAFNSSESRLLELVSDGDDTVRTNITLSYRELNDADRDRYNRLAVFAPTGFSKIAAAAIWGQTESETRAALERMQEASLVKPVADAPGRFQLHDLLQDYAREQLARDKFRESAAERAHADFLIVLFDKYYGDDLSTAPAVFLEKDNLIEAAEWAKTLQDGDLLALLATKPRNWLYNIFRINTEWLDWLDTALQKGITQTQLQANTRQAIGDVQRFRDDNDAALASYTAALALFQQVGDRLGEANTLQAIGDVQQFRKDNDAALESYNAALKLFQQVGSRLGEANTLQAIGDVQQFRKDNDAALESYNAALKLFQQVGDRLGEANTRKAIGDVQQFRKDNDAALASYTAALALFQQVGSRLGEAYTRKAIGDVQQFRKDNDAALASYTAALALFQQVGDRLGEANVYLGTGELKRAQGKSAGAKRDYENALGLYREIGDRYSQARAFLALGDLARDAGDKTQALQLYQQTADFLQSIGLSDLVEQVLEARIKSVQ